MKLNPRPSSDYDRWGANIPYWVIEPEDWTMLVDLVKMVLADQQRSDCYNYQITNIIGYVEKSLFHPNPALRINILSSTYQLYAPQGHFFQGA
jgi:hypothetical protein